MANPPCESSQHVTGGVDLRVAGGAAGVPLELVQKVTGHKTTDIVLKHYFQPGREAFREALQSAMPKLLTNGSAGNAERGARNAEAWGQVEKAPKEEMRAIIERATPKTWKRDKARLLALVAGA